MTTGFHAPSWSVLSRNMEIISRADALAQGQKWYFTGKPCKHGHVSKRSTHSHTCRGCSNEGHKERRTNPVGRAKRLLTDARTRASKFALEFDLDTSWVEERLSKGVCSVTQLPFVLIRGATRKHPMAPSIDRIDSTLGYTKENCRLVVTIYNFAKNEWSDADVLMLAKALTIQ
jgi:hypothetical protein